MNVAEIEVEDVVANLSEDEAWALLYDWRGTWARPQQIPPDDGWFTWLYLAGRGSGKTRSAAEFVREQVYTGQSTRPALIGPTSGDVRDIMIEGESGLLATSPPWFMPKYQPSKRRLVWPNGVRAALYSADEPERLRGPSHDFFWADEIASWRYYQYAWDMLKMMVRLGKARGVVSTTPKPIKVLRDLIKEHQESGEVHLSTETTYDNLHNLSAAYRKATVEKYEGTRLGRQELMAELLEDVPGALWTRSDIEKNRVRAIDPKNNQLQRIVVGVDPSASSGDNASHAGIVVSGVDAQQHGYAVEDCSIRGRPELWAARVSWAFERWNADCVIAEKNNGGEMVLSTLRAHNPNLPVKSVHASRGKITRAEPISLLAEQGKIHHAGNELEHLEDELCTYDGSGDSPDRLDAFVWGQSELLLNRSRWRGLG